MSAKGKFIQLYARWRWCSCVCAEISALLFKWKWIEIVFWFYESTVQMPCYCVRACMSLAFINNLQLLYSMKTHTHKPNSIFLSLFVYTLKRFLVFGHGMLNNDSVAIASNSRKYCTQLVYLALKRFYSMGLKKKSIRKFAQMFNLMYHFSNGNFFAFLFWNLPNGSSHAWRHNVWTLMK